MPSIKLQRRRSPKSKVAGFVAVPFSFVLFCAAQGRVNGASFCYSVSRTPNVQQHPFAFAVKSSSTSLSLVSLHPHCASYPIRHVSSKRRSHHHQHQQHQHPKHALWANTQQKHPPGRLLAKRKNNSDDDDDNSNNDDDMETNLLYSIVDGWTKLASLPTPLPFFRHVPLVYPVALLLGGLLWLPTIFATVLLLVLFGGFSLLGQQATFVADNNSEEEEEEEFWFPINLVAMVASIISTQLISPILWTTNTSVDQNGIQRGLSSSLSVSALFLVVVACSVVVAGIQGLQQDDNDNDATIQATRNPQRKLMDQWDQEFFKRQEQTSKRKKNDM